MLEYQLDLIEECADFSEYCGPPVFDLPPPPRPPWLEDIDKCSDLGLCPNDPIVSSTVQDATQGIFHSVITVVVASIAIVISLILIALFIWR